MKKLLMILLVVMGISVSASAQHRYYGHRPYTRSHVVVSVGRPIYPYYGYYDPFYSPYYSRLGYYYSPRETKLDLKIEDIRADYQDKIWSAKHNNNLSRVERKRVVHELKHERDQAIIQAKRNYYRS